MSKATFFTCKSFVLCLCIFLPIEARADAPVYVGVFEDFSPNFNDQSQLTLQPHVRVAFKKDAAGWVPMETDETEALPMDTLGGLDELAWNTVFDGKLIGKIVTRNPEDITHYGDVGIQKITSDSKKNPHVNVGAKDFSYSPGGVRTRPVLVVSDPNYKDPDGWKPTALTEAEKIAAKQEFRNEHPNGEWCDGTPEGSELPKPAPYADDQITFIKAYRSHTGELIYGMQLDPKQSKCELYDDETYYDYWFVYDRDKHIRSIGDQMMPLDAADLDGDGKSEWVFQTSRPEDEDGYRLFYNDFNKVAYFRWFYH